MINPAQNSFLIFLPKKDFNEDEFTIVRKRLLKAGKQVLITSDDQSVCSSCKGMKVKSDTSFYNVNTNNFAAIILIGGLGSKAYWKNQSLYKIIKNFFGMNSGNFLVHGRPPSCQQLAVNYVIIIT